MVKNNIKRFSLINTVEGYSFLVLIFIAMPLKYMYGVAIAVKIVGMIHGILFIAFIALLLLTSQEIKWPVKQSAIFFIASLIPFGTFFTKRKILSYT